MADKITRAGIEDVLNNFPEERPMSYRQIADCLFPDRSTEPKNAIPMISMRVGRNIQSRNPIFYSTQVEGVDRIGLITDLPPEKQEEILSTTEGSPSEESDLTRKSKETDNKQLATISSSVLSLPPARVVGINDVAQRLFFYRATSIPRVTRRRLAVLTSVSLTITGVGWIHQQHKNGPSFFVEAGSRVGICMSEDCPEEVLAYGDVSALVGPMTLTLYPEDGADSIQVGGESYSKYDIDVPTDKTIYYYAIPNGESVSASGESVVIRAGEIELEIFRAVVARKPDYSDAQRLLLTYDSRWLIGGVAADPQHHFRGPIHFGLAVTPTSPIVKTRFAAEFESSLRAVTLGGNDMPAAFLGFELKKDETLLVSSLRR